MHTINIRNVDDSIYEKLKNEAQKSGLSINDLLLKMLDKFFDIEKNEVEYHDLDEFFGTWSEEEYKLVKEGTAQARQIDEELWK